MPLALPVFLVLWLLRAPLLLLLLLPPRSLHLLLHLRLLLLWHCWAKHLQALLAPLLHQRFQMNLLQRLMPQLLSELGGSAVG